MTPFVERLPVGMQSTTSSSPRSGSLNAPARLLNEKVDANRSEPVWLWQGYLPSLNGLRALSMILVIVAHLSDKPSTFLSYPVLIPLGAAGVEMFFVISGFLITLLLLRERRLTGKVSLTGFYLRRLFRIVPAYAFFLLVLLALEMAEVIHIPALAWVRAVTYTTSLFQQAPGSWDLGHTWSLSVEEHFYLLWPGVFVLLGTRASLLSAVGCVLLTPLLRFMLYAGFRDALPEFGYFTPTRMDAIAAGCCLAYLATSDIWRRATHLATQWSTVAAIVAGVASGVWLIGLTGIFDHDKSIGYLNAFLAPTLRPILMAWLVWACVSTPASLIGRVLNSKVLHFLGILSYSIYLWQQVFLHAGREHWMCQLPWNIGCILGAALCSYFFIEKPFLVLKDRLASARGKRHPNLPRYAPATGS